MITDKIKKLLALSESPNESEAQAALMKAWELMVKHNLSMDDICDVKSEPVITIKTDITYTMRSNGWVAELASVIAENNRCIGIQTRQKGKQKACVEFVGLRQDVEAAVAMFRYAYTYVTAETTTIKRNCKCLGMTSTDATYEAQSYGLGFARGLDAAYRAALEENQAWGLVVTIPEAVQDACKGYKAKKSTSIRASNKSTMYTDGFTAGHDYGSKKNRLAAAYCG